MCIYTGLSVSMTVILFIRFEEGLMMKDIHEIEHENRNHESNKFLNLVWK